MLKSSYHSATTTTLGQLIACVPNQKSAYMGDIKHSFSLFVLPLQRRAFVCISPLQSCRAIPMPNQLLAVQHRCVENPQELVCRVRALRIPRLRESQRERPLE